MQYVIQHPASWRFGPLVIAGHHLGPFDLTGFGIAMLLAFIIAQLVMTAELDRRGHEAAANSMSDITVAAVIGGLLGAKLWYVALTRDSIFHRGGFVFWGGLLGGIASTFAVMRWKKVSFWRIADVGGIGLAAAYAVGRSGCWAVGDDYGREWISRFAVAFPEGAPPSVVRNMIELFGQKSLAGRPPTELVGVYPTQLFEVAMGFVMFAILWRMRKHTHAEGWLFGIYCMLAGTERFIVEFYRAKDDRMFGALTLAQLVAIGFIAAGAFIAVSFRSRSLSPASSPGPAAAAQ
jgi:phosphatidylglycerol:prolipoprotein diacylglycerol transferase